jgi:prepilin-type N-terminal cleavage/methylation domain-containing protein
MRTRAPRGFTLLEVVVALTITALITTMALVAADVSLASGERVAQHRATTEVQLQFRALLMDALRHAVPGNGPVDTVFAIGTGYTPNGLRADTLTFRSRGLTALAGAGDEWQVTVYHDGVSVLLRALTDDPAMPVLQTRLDDVQGLALRVIPPADSVWSERWSGPGTVPRALEARFIGRDGQLLGVPLVTRVGAESWR